MSIAESMELPQVHLSPGELLFTREPRIVVTVLGSCVAVTMFDRQSGHAGICHAMLACSRSEEPCLADDPRRFRYVSVALSAMVVAYRRAGLDLRNVEVKLFGGGDVIRRSVSCATRSIGSENVEAARAFFSRHGIAVAAENTGGRIGRKILFNTTNGEVLHKHLRQSLT